MPSRCSLLFALDVGVLHAVGLLAVALELGYAVGPAEYSLVGLGWRYGGLVGVAALPTWLAVRYRLLTPLVALVLTTGDVLGMELTPPDPTFRQSAPAKMLVSTHTLTVVCGRTIRSSTSQVA